MTRYLLTLALRLVTALQIGSDRVATAVAARLQRVRQAIVRAIYRWR